MEDRQRYTPSDCFETFPFVEEWESFGQMEGAGKQYLEARSTFMIENNIGLTKTYNRFNDRGSSQKDIQRLRELHSAMDCAVLEAYGWHDLAKEARPVFLDEDSEHDSKYQGRLFWPSDFRDEVLARLLALNAERHAEEVRLGIAPGMKGKEKDVEGNEAEND